MDVQAAQLRQCVTRCVSVDGVELSLKLRAHSPAVANAFPPSARSLVFTHSAVLLPSSSLTPTSVHRCAVTVTAGKPEQHCSIDALDERWRRGRPECWLPPGVDASSAAAAAAAAAGATTAEESMGRASHEEEDAERKEALA